ncbi:MAG: response regulator transcription factor, partial [Anaerovorax sp.]
GDDYITKPFLPGELIARIKANLRRNSLRESQETESPSLYKFPGLTIDTEEREIFVDGSPVSLLHKEFEILKLFVENPKRIFSAIQIFESVWKTTCLDGDARTVMVYISTLRKKIETNPSNPKYIASVRGLGYKLNYRNFK